MRVRSVAAIVRLVAALALVAGIAPPATPDCTWDACVRCELRPNGQWICKIVFQNAYCNCDVLGGSGCSQSESCRMIP